MKNHGAKVGRGTGRAFCDFAGAGAAIPDAIIFTGLGTCGDSKSNVAVFASTILHAFGEKKK